MKKEEVTKSTTSSRKPILITILIVAAVFMILGVLIGKNTQGRQVVGQCVGTGQAKNLVTQLPPGTYYLPDGNEIWVVGGLIYTDQEAKKATNKGFNCYLPDDILPLFTLLEDTKITDLNGNKYSAFVAWYGSDIPDVDTEGPEQVEMPNP